MPENAPKVVISNSSTSRKKITGIIAMPTMFLTKIKSLKVVPRNFLGAKECVVN